MTAKVDASASPQRRDAPIDMNPEQFRKLGYGVVDTIAGFLASMRERPVAPDASPRDVRQRLGQRPLPRQGSDPGALLEEAAGLLFDFSRFNSHPRFWGYINAGPAPIGVLADFLAAAVNPNVVSWNGAPMATEIEAQTVRWIAEMLGFPTDCSGLLVSGGTMANFVGLLAARRAKAGWDTRKEGMTSQKGRPLRIYATEEAHTWLQKAVDMSGMGTDTICWIPVDRDLRMDVAALEQQIKGHVATDDQPFLVVGTAGTVGTGAIDPLKDIAAICKQYGLWFHVDGAYGAFAAILPDAPPDLAGLRDADSIAVDPHKWLYAPLEAGCVLVRDGQALSRTFSWDTAYFHLEKDPLEAPIHYYEFGPQNSRNFRALKVWLALRHVGYEGYVRMISEDVFLARELYRTITNDPEFEPFTHSLSITTFRYVPTDLKPDAENANVYLDRLNSELLTRLQKSGEAYISKAVVAGRFALRACVVNFRTTLEDILALPDIVKRIGREIDYDMRPTELRSRS